MMSNIGKDFKDQMLNSQFSQIMFSTGASDISSSTFTVENSTERVSPIEELSEGMASSASSYSLVCDQSIYGHQIDRWLHCPVLPTENTGVQLSRAPLVQRSTLISSSLMDSSGIWYVLAMILPLFSLNNTTLWRCSSGNVLNAANVFLNNLKRICGEARVQVQRLAENQMARDFFATLMDIVLVIYAIGFLILSLYQASMFG